MGCGMSTAVRAIALGQEVALATPWTAAFLRAALDVGRSVVTARNAVSLMLCMAAHQEAYDCSDQEPITKADDLSLRGFVAANGDTPAGIVQRDSAICSVSRRDDVQPSVR